ncbi:MAG TPA: RluA family pseudouridine synthase [Candidatus Binatia bacterium]|jgi:23S rRNA pseudouridine1911/1915/1917 synthase
MRGGASIEHEAHVAEAIPRPWRLVDYLKERLVAVPVTEIGNLITSGCVRIGTPGAVGRTMDMVACGDRITIERAALESLRLRGRWNPPWDHVPDVLYEDDDLLVVHKNAGLHVHPLGDHRECTLVGALLHRAGLREQEPWAAWRPHVVQRLDCVVSGLLVVAKGAVSKAALVRVQKAGRLERRYLAVVDGCVGDDDGVIDAPVGRDEARGWRRAIVREERGGERAITRWRIVARLAHRTIVELEPETGRTHQLRVHLASIGHPIAGDVLYGGSRLDAFAARDGEAVEAAAMSIPADLVPAPDERLGNLVRPIALHARRISLQHPRLGTTIDVEHEPCGRAFALAAGEEWANAARSALACRPPPSI